MVETNGNGNAISRALLRLLVPVIIPALTAFGASYVAVAIQMARFDERLVAMRELIETTQDFRQLQIDVLMAVDKEHAAELTRLRALK